MQVSVITIIVDLQCISFTFYEKTVNVIVLGQLAVERMETASVREVPV